ncbi:MAG: hypothetical protein M0Z36_06355 [Thermaerobacter sp.]|nr:hypothetical protein [Thermaerobacter sp.]
MRTAQISVILAGLWLSAGLQACGTAAPAPNNSGKGATHSSKAAQQKKGQSGTKAGSGKAAFSGGTTNKRGATANPARGKNKKTTGGTANTGTKGRRTMVGRNKNRGSVAKLSPISLTTLPKTSAVAKFNPHMNAYHETSTFINQMGYHWATAVPGIGFMTNQHNQITAVEATFPQNHGDFSWYDPATPPNILNASLAYYSEHLDFVPSTSITTSMPATMTTSLSSWSQFVANNPRLKVYTKEAATFRGYAVYAPPSGPGIKVLVSPTGVVSGFMVAEPAYWGHHPLYIGPGKRPFMDHTYGKAYYSVFMLEPPTASTNAAKSGA